MPRLGQAPCIVRDPDPTGMQDYRKLVVWQRAHRFVVVAYERLAAFPSDERYELTSQLRRALVSVPTNLVEGRSRNSARSFAAFVDIAAGSAAEVEYLLLLARDLGYLEESVHRQLANEIDEIRRMLGALRARVSTRLEVRNARRSLPPSLNADG
jgi:four helix bundle protein